MPNIDGWDGKVDLDKQKLEKESKGVRVCCLDMRKKWNKSKAI
jgi:hypothetical protein